MIRAETGGSEKVSGRSMAMVASGPRPGSTPTAVPKQAADEGVEQVPRAERGGEAQAQMVEQFHGAGSLTGPVRGRRGLRGGGGGGGGGDQ